MQKPQPAYAVRMSFREGALVAVLFCEKAAAASSASRRSLATRAPRHPRVAVVREPFADKRKPLLVEKSIFVTTGLLTTRPIDNKRQLPGQDMRPLTGEPAALLRGQYVLWRQGVCHQRVIGDKGWPVSGPIRQSRHRGQNVPPTTYVACQGKGALVGSSSSHIASKGIELNDGTSTLA